MGELLQQVVLFAPAFFSLMFGAFWFPYLGKKGKSLKRKAIEAGLVAGLISLTCYTLFAIFDIGFPQLTVEAKMRKAIGAFFIMMFGTGIIAYGSIDKAKIQ